MRGLLKFVTCGSVDDGKSTLIGHMLYDAKCLFADQERVLEMESKLGSREGKLDYSLLLDGLMAEREQGITIDVAYRYFSTEHRSFIVADAPGHEEYTQNMAVGASFADLAVILVDATKGLLVQTRRHARICALMGIRSFVFAINKMDLVHYDEQVYRRLEKEVERLAALLELKHVVCIPVSATEGDNVATPSLRMPWFRPPWGGTLLRFLETVDIQAGGTSLGFALPVQRVCRPHREFRGFQGEIVSGSVSVGDEVSILPSRERARIHGILIGDQKAERAGEGQPVTLQLDREVDVSRGDVMTKGMEIHVSDLLSVSLLWMDKKQLLPGRGFWLKLAACTVPAIVTHIKRKVDINTGEPQAAGRLCKNEIGVAELRLNGKIACTAFSRCRSLGSFILIDRISHRTSACGTVRHPLRRSDNLVWQPLDITRKMRAESLGQRPLTVWFTGLSGAGKSTLANVLEQRLALEGKHTMLLDGDNVRMGLNRDLGFTEEDRIENIRRVAEVARLMNDAGLIVITAFVSPYRADREHARAIIGEENFFEVYVSTPLEECERRDVKGLYQKARSGHIPNFTGIFSPYEPPTSPELIVDTTGRAVEETLEEVLRGLDPHMKEEPLS